MILVIGGAYQGKKDFSIEKFNLIDKDIYICCDDQDLFKDLEKDNLGNIKVVYNINNYVFNLLANEKNPLELIKNNLHLLDGKIIIVDDIFCGVVPMDKQVRLYRECMGRCLVYMSKNSDEVYRVFCGIGTKIKCI